MKFTKTFHKLKECYSDPNCRYVVMPGGTRSGKSYSIMQLCILLCMYSKDPKFCCSVVCPTMGMAKRGPIKDLKEIMQDENIWEDSRWNASDFTYHFPSGSYLEVFSGDQSAKCQGSRRTLLFIDEAYLLNYETARQLFVRTTGKIIIAYNPTSSFWAEEQIAPRPNARLFRSTYLDNDFLTPEQITEIESNKKDAQWWKVFGLGETGTAEGVIYSYNVIDELPLIGSSIWGIDFGFSNDPTAIVHLRVDQRKKEVYIQECCYQTQMLNSDIIDRLKEIGCPKRSDELYADCAEPKAIAEIGKAGFNIKPCKKSAPVKSGKLKFQIQWMKGWTFFVTRDSVNLLKELQNYTWAKDKDGKLLNEPIDMWNHLLDSLRYALWGKYGKSSTGKYYLK